MSNNVNLLSILKAAVKNEDELFSTTCKVTSVDVEAETCEAQPIDDSAALFDIKLSAGTSSTSNLYIPVVGSFIIVTFISNTACYVSMFSELSAVNIKGSEFGGLVKVQELTDRLNNIEKAFNDFVSKTYNTHVHASSGVVTASLGSPTTTTNKTDIENTTVKHG